MSLSAYSISRTKQINTSANCSSDHVTTVRKIKSCCCKPCPLRRHRIGLPRGWRRVVVLLHVCNAKACTCILYTSNTKANREPQLYGDRSMQNLLSVTDSMYMHEFVVDMTDSMFDAELPVSEDAWPDVYPGAKFRGPGIVGTDNDPIPFRPVLRSTRVRQHGHAS